MSHMNTKQLRAAISEYAQPSTGLAVTLFIIDIVLYVSAIAGIIFLESMILRLMCCLVAGSMISSLFVIGHDAAHHAFTDSKLLNKIIARIAFLPSLHNYGLWLTEHNRIHHRSTNVQGLDSWSPLSKAEYDALPSWRQRLERFYRSVPGIPFYYMIERWWKNKFFPYDKISGKYNSVYWDFTLVITYLVSYLCFLGFLGNQLGHTTSAELIILGFVIPFMNWNFMMGFTVYQHHTHETIAWVKSIEERNYMGGQEDFTMHVRFPRWYNLISHNIMEHTAHHVDPRIPLYNLSEAQNALVQLLGDEIHMKRFTFKSFLQTMSKCKLYDFENKRWLDFDGNPSCETDVAGANEDLCVKAA